MTLGQKIHSWQYKAPKGFEDQTVLIVGIGNSGGDMAVELGRVAKQVSRLALSTIVSDQYEHSGLSEHTSWYVGLESCWTQWIPS